MDPYIDILMVTEKGKMSLKAKATIWIVITVDGQRPRGPQTGTKLKGQN